MLAVDVLVQPAQEGDGLQVLAAPVGVRHPLARLARVVEVQHRGHRVHPQAVGVEDVEPEHRARQQEAADLVAPVVEDEAVPVGVVALAAVGVLVEVRPVEVGEAVLVCREVRRHPVEDDPDPALVEGVHQVHQVLGRALAAGGGEVPEALVAPRPVEGVLHHRQELDVGEAHLLDVVGERGCQLAVREEAGGLGGVAAPGAEVHLVGRARGGERLARAPFAHPLAVAPRVVEVPDDGAGAGRGLVAVGEGVGLVDLVPVEAGDHVVLVHGPRAQPRHEALEEARLASQAQGMAVGLPLIELAHDRDARRRGRPDREGRPVLAAPRPGVRAEFQVGSVVGPLVEEVDVLVGEQRPGPPRSSSPHGPHYGAAGPRAAE